MRTQNEINALLPEMVRLYRIEGSQDRVAKVMGLSSSLVYRHLKKAGLIGIRKGIKGSRNAGWRGNEVSVQVLHKWVRRWLPKPELCQHCHTKPPLDLANVSPKYDPSTYNRDFNNWEWLCRRCHMVKDGRIEGLKLTQYDSAPRQRLHELCMVEGCNNRYRCSGMCSSHYGKVRYEKSKIRSGM